MSPSGCAHFRDDVSRPRLDDALRLQRESWPRLQRESAPPSQRADELRPQPSVSLLLPPLVSLPFGRGEAPLLQRGGVPLPRPAAGPRLRLCGVLRLPRAFALQFERASVLRLPPDAGRSPLRDGELRLPPDAGRRARSAFGRLRAPAPGRSRPRRRGISSRHAGAIHLPARAFGPRLPKGDAVLRRRPALAPLPHVVAFPVPRGALLRQRAAELQRQRGAHLPWPACASILLRRARAPAPPSGGDSLPRRVHELRRRFSVSRVPHADVNSRLPPGSDAHARSATHFQPPVSLPRTPPGGFALPLSNESARLPTA